MKEKILKTLLIIFLFAGFLCLSFNKANIMKVKADSGFDSSYDSGSDWGSDSSWDSGSSWDSDSSYSSGGSSSPLVTFIIIIIIIIVVFSNKGKIANISSLNLDKTKEINDDKIKKYLPDFNKTEFLNARYEDYLAIQKAWTDFDYDKIREKVTDELYNQYSMQLDTLKVKNEKNIMKDFKFKDAIVTGISNENNQITINIELIASFIDYIDKNGSPVRGNSISPITMHYEMTFVCNLTDKLDKCPNCGGKLDNSASKKCEYCGSVITNVSGNWVMSKKEAKNQR